MKSIIVGFGHKARHGKDYCVQAIIEKYGSQFDIKRYSFAGALKAAFYDLLKQPNHDYWNFVVGRLVLSYLKLPHPPLDSTPTPQEKEDWINEHKGEGIAAHLQLFGTEYVRSKDPFYWVKQVRKQIEEEQPQFALISDMRFKNEYAFVKAFGGYTVKVTRVGFVDPTRDPNHPSEIDLDGVPFDFSIECGDGQLEELRKDAIYVFNMIVEANNPKLEALEEVSVGLPA